MRNWDSRYAARADRITASEIRELLKLLDRPGIISFAGGIPDPRAVPASRRIAAAYAGMLDEAATARRCSTRSARATCRCASGSSGTWRACGVAVRRPSNILITNGSQQALDFLGKLFIGPGDTVLADAPDLSGRPAGLQRLRGRHGAFPGLGGAGAGGGQARLSDARLRQPDRPHLDLRRAATRLLDRGRGARLPVDRGRAPIAQLRFERRAASRSLLALDIARRRLHRRRPATIYCGTFSKTVVPAPAASAGSARRGR